MGRPGQAHRRDVGCPRQDLGRLEPSEQAQWKTKKPAPGESGSSGGCRCTLSGPFSHKVVERVPAKGLSSVPAIVHRALDVGMGAAKRLLRYCRNPAEASASRPL